LIKLLLTGIGYSSSAVIHHRHTVGCLTQLYHDILIEKVIACENNQISWATEQYSCTLSMMVVKILNPSYTDETQFSVVFYIAIANLVECCLWVSFKNYAVIVSNKVMKVLLVHGTAKKYL